MGEEGYAMLVGKEFQYVVTTKSLQLGRKQKQKSDKAGHLELGDGKSISRQHAELKWDPSSRRWQLICLGKNGLALNGKQHTPDTCSTEKPVGLAHKDRIEIGEVDFFFLLPTITDRA